MAGRAYVVARADAQRRFAPRVTRQSQSVAWEIASLHCKGAASCFAHGPPVALPGGHARPDARINLGGIPGADAPSAFLIFLLILTGVVALQLIIFKTKKWL